MEGRTHGSPSRRAFFTSSSVQPSSYPTNQLMDGPRTHDLLPPRLQLHGLARSAKIRRTISILTTADFQIKKTSGVVLRWTRTRTRCDAYGRQEVDERHPNAEISKVMRLGFGMVSVSCAPMSTPPPSLPHLPSPQSPRAPCAPNPRPDRDHQCINDNDNVIVDFNHSIT